MSEDGTTDGGSVVTEPANIPILPNYHLKFTLKGHQDSVSSIKFSPDGLWLATACKNKKREYFLNRSLIFILYFIVMVCLFY